MLAALGAVYADELGEDSFGDLTAGEVDALTTHIVKEFLDTTCVKGGQKLWREFYNMEHPHAMRVLKASALSALMRNVIGKEKK